MFKIAEGEPFFTSLNFLKKTYQIPASAEKSYLRKYYTIFLLVKVVAFFSVSIGPLLHMIMSIRNNSKKNLTEDFSFMFGGTGGGIVTLIFTLKYRQWSKYFEDLTNSAPYKPRKLHEYANRLNRLGRICVFSGIWVTIIYGIAALYNSKGCKDLNGTDKSDEICPMFAPIWLPFGQNNFTLGLIVSSLQAFCNGYLTGQPFLAECFIMFESTEILICHISQLRKDIRSTFEVTSILEKKKRFRLCVEYHVYILKMGKRLNLLIKYTAGHMSLLSALVCGCVANQILNTKPMGSIMFLMAWLFALLCFCHSGQRINDKTLSVAEAIWDSKWYTADPVTLRDVQLMLMRSQKPICFEALPMGVTDYPLFFATIKTAYTYFALFRKSL